MMRPLDPRQIWVLRIRVAIFAAALVAVSTAIEAAADAWPMRGLMPGLAVLIGLVLLLWLPQRRYRAWSFREDEDELHVRHGLLVRMRTIVPFVRVQHIDLAQGPVERSLGLATLILHTAGTRGSSVRLPGLAQAEAEAMRDRVRARIRLEPA